MWIIPGLCFALLIIWATNRSMKPQVGDVPAKFRYDIDYRWNPLETVMQAAIDTGKHFDNVFLRNAEADQLAQDVLRLEDENELLREVMEWDTTQQLADQHTTVATTIVPFKPEEPRRFADYAGQPHITVPLEKAVRALAPDRQVIDHKLFTGLPGIGKTLIAKVTGHELDLRAKLLGHAGVPFFWSFGANLNKVELLDGFVREIKQQQGGVWFIDEIHVLDQQLQTKIYSLMEDGVYPFEGQTNPTPVPNTVVLGATTDYGGMHPALKRRFGEPMMLRRLPREAILTIILSGHFPMQDGAAELLADRTHWSGAPWEALVLRREAEIFAKAAGRAVVTEFDVRDVFQTYAIDEHGLRWVDREVLKALFKRPRTKGKDNTFVCFGASEADICAVAALDPVEYRETVKPRLLSRGLLEVRSGYGQALTEQALAQYGHLKP